MRACFRTAAVLAVLGLGAAFARADLAIDKPKKKTGPGYTTVTVEPGRADQLIIPRAVLKQILKAAADGDAGDARAQLGLPTIMTGLFLSMALVCTGLWLVRTGKTGRRLTAALALAGLAGAATAFTWADEALPPRRQPAFKGINLDGVRVVISDTEKNVRLQLTPPQTTTLRNQLMNALVTPPAGATPPPVLSPRKNGNPNPNP